MDIASALRYPFQSVAKVLTIVLALSIALVICLALVAGSADWTAWVQELQSMFEDPEAWAAAHEAASIAADTEAVAAEHEGAAAAALDMFTFPAGAGFGLLLMLLVAVFGGFWFSGYSLDVVRSVMAGKEAMPEFEIGGNLLAGFQLFLACLAYGIAACLGLAVYLVVGSLGGVLALVGLILLVVFWALLGWGYYVGMARFAAGEGLGALFGILANTLTARREWKAGLALTGWSIVLALVYKVASSVIDGIVGGLMAGDIVLDFAILIVVYFAFNFFQHFSTQHLLAQYAMSIGISARVVDKEKFSQE